MAQSQAAPEEPDIVLPEVILRIEDFSVESLSGAAPGEEDTCPRRASCRCPPARSRCSPSPRPLQPNRRPSRRPRSGPCPPWRSWAPAPATTCSARWRCTAWESDPRFSLRFLHETLDGLAGQPPGSGFDFRKDELEGALKLRLGKASLKLDGSLHETERGLQG